jgi:hypothetical protein
MLPPWSCITELESAILRLLCIDPGAPMIVKLSRYRWQSREHQVVYDAICKLASGGPTLLAEQLPAQAVRMGFPDVEWPRYLDPGLTPDADIGHLIEELKKVAPDK